MRALPRQEPPDDYLNLRAAAALVGVHPDTLRRQIDQGRLPALVFGRTYRIQRADVQRLAVPAPAPPAPDPAVPPPPPAPATRPAGDVGAVLATIEGAVGELRAALDGAGFLDRHTG